MEVLIVIMGSIVISVSFFYYISIKGIKDLADKGYRKNVNPYDTSNMSEDEKMKEYFISLFIPGVNIGTLLKILENYFNLKSYSDDDLLRMNLIVAYTPEEQKRYDESKTIKTARDILMEAYLKENKLMKITFIYKQGINKIWFESYGDRYIINRSKGPVSKLSLQEQYAILNEFIAINDRELAKKSQDQPNTNPHTDLDSPTSNNTRSQEIEAEKTELQRIKDNLTKPNNSLGQQLRRRLKRNDKQPRL